MENLLDTESFQDLEGKSRTASFRDGKQEKRVPYPVNGIHKMLYRRKLG